MLVSLNMAAGSQRKHLAYKLECKHITIKKSQEKTFLQAWQRSQAAIIMASCKAKTSKMQHAVFQTHRILSSWKLVKRLYF